MSSGTRTSEFKSLVTVFPNDPGGWIHFSVSLSTEQGPQQLTWLASSYVVWEWQALPCGAKSLTNANQALGPRFWPHHTRAPAVPVLEGSPRHAQAASQAQGGWEAMKRGLV